METGPAAASWAAGQGTWSGACLPGPSSHDPDVLCQLPRNAGRTNKTCGRLLRRKALEKASAVRSLPLRTEPGLPPSCPQGLAQIRQLPSSSPPVPTCTARGQESRWHPEACHPQHLPTRGWGPGRAGQRGAGLSTTARSLAALPSPSAQASSQGRRTHEITSGKDQSSSESTGGGSRRRR